MQADTYLGTASDPLSLNLYTYCLNNPHKYTDPSGHFVITAAAVLLAARIATSLVSGVLSAKAEYDRQVAEGDNYTDWMSVLFVGGANAGLSFVTFGIGSGAVKGAGVGAKLLFKHLGKAVVRDAAIGALMDAGIETARQLVTGTKITNLEYDRINEAGVMGGIIGGGSTLVGAALEGLAKTRVVKSAVAKISQTASKGTNAIKSGFAKIAGKSEKSSVREMTGLGESRFKLNLQFFAGSAKETNGFDTPVSLKQALAELDASGLRPGQTQLYMSQLNDVLDAVKYHYDPVKAKSSVFSDGVERYVVNGHHTTVAFKMLNKSSSFNMNVATQEMPSTTKVYWTKKWYEFWKKAIEIVED